MMRAKLVVARNICIFPFLPGFCTPVAPANEEG